MEKIKNLSITGSKEKPILLDIFYKNNGIAKPIVIFSHGFKGFKDWGHFNEVAQQFAEADFIFIKFNFSYNGTTPQDPTNFNDLEAFGNNNYIIELDDLNLVMDWSLTNELIKDEINQEQLYLLGHSRGGGITILKSGEDSRVKKIVTWASVSNFINRNKQRTIDTWKKDGVVYAMNGRTKQNMPMYYQFYQTLLDNKERLNINHAVKRVNIPLLIVHGTNDEAVDYHDAEELKKSAKQGILLTILNANHTFGVKHPFDDIMPNDAQQVIEKTIHFFKTNN